jgi:hypothetical protein
MKFRILTLVIALLTVSGAAVYAQSESEPAVKILRTGKPGMIKLIYAIETNEPLTVKFLTDRGVAGSHKVKGAYPKGWLKRYDVSSIDNKEFWIEISSPQRVLTYHIVPEDGDKYAATLEKTTYNHMMVRSNN